MLFQWTSVYVTIFFYIFDNLADVSLDGRNWLHPWLRDIIISRVIGGNIYVNRLYVTGGSVAYATSTYLA